MGLSSRSPKSVILVALLGAAVTGCDISDGGGGGGETYGLSDNPPVQAQKAPIDADATLQVTPGDGVGVFIEYATGGHWHVFTSCDTNQPTNPGVACTFDVLASAVTAGAVLSNANGESLDSKDVLAVGGDGTVHLSTETTTGLNGMTFDADPGTIVELDVYLDNQEDPHYIYWMGDKVLHQGAPTDPLDLVPSEKPAGTGGTGGAGGAGGSGTGAK